MPIDGLGSREAVKVLLLATTAKVVDGMECFVTVDASVERERGGLCGEKMLIGRRGRGQKFQQWFVCCSWREEDQDMGGKEVE